MTRHFDEFSKSLAESCSRRESLRAFGALVAGGALSQLPLSSVWAGASNACKTFCNRCPTRLRSQCLSACQACGGKTSRLCGSCGAYACCGAGASCCSGYCAKLADDFYNCGACGHACEPPGPYENGACIDGKCEYICAQGAVSCHGACTSLDWDPNNCGGCGNVCPDSAPNCGWGTCQAGACEGPFVAWCPGVGCTNLLSDSANCGACGVQCAADELCTFGVCLGTCSGC
jgi:hypothetical protein